MLLMLERVQAEVKQEARKPIDIRVVLEQLGIELEKWQKANT